MFRAELPPIQKSIARITTIAIDGTTDIRNNIVARDNSISCTNTINRSDVG